MSGMIKQPLMEHRGFSDALLSLRGIAAMMVLVFHAMLAFKIKDIDPRWFHFPSLQNLSLFFDEFIVFITNGGAAVTFFFVHSGFVLGLSLDKSHDRTSDSIFTFISSFWIRRAFRLFPMIFFSSFLGFLTIIYFYNASPVPSVSKWFCDFFPQAYNYKLKDVLVEGILVRSNLNKFAWSLQVEVLISAILPFVYLSLRHKVSSFLLLIGIFALSTLNRLEFLPTYMICFVLGISIGNMKSNLDTFFSLLKKSNGYRCDLIIICAFAIMILDRPLYIGGEQFVTIIEALSSVPIIYCIYYIEAGNFYHFCNHAVIKMLGRISYSLYMVSCVSIYLSVILISALLGPHFIAKFGLLSNLAVTLIAIVIAVSLSNLSYKYLEAPMMEFGKKLGDKVISLLQRSEQQQEA